MCVPQPHTGPTATAPRAARNLHTMAADRVRAIFAHGYQAYETHAFGRDEVHPLSNRSNDRWGGLAVTMVDALDTMLLMGLHETFARARTWLLAHLPGRIQAGGDVPFFEVTIRVLGGLLSAAILSGGVSGGTIDPELLQLATQLGKALEPALSVRRPPAACTDQTLRQDRRLRSRLRAPLLPPPPPLLRPYAFEVLRRPTRRHPVGCPSAPSISLAACHHAL